VRRRGLGLAGVALATVGAAVAGASSGRVQAAPAIVAPSASAVTAGAAAPGAPPGPRDGAARFVLIVGVNRSVDADMPQLRYADDDAARYQELFRALGGRIFLLTRPDENTRRISGEAISAAREPRRAELSRAVAALGVDVAAARARGQRTLFYFVYAGHGNVSGSTAYLALEDARLDGDEIEREIVDKVHADESHLIIDACYSYFLAYGRGPGGSRHPVRRFATSEGLAHRPDVGLLLSTTSARESHEWEGFQAGIFSHEVRSGLYGAADLDGDGQISYLEIAAFVSRANAAIPNERFRPDVFAHPPRAAAQLIDLRQATGRRLRVDATAQASHYLFEDTLGVRLVDFHNADGRALSLLLPASPRALYLRRASDEQEFAIPAEPAVVNLAELTPQPPRELPRGGSAEFAFNLLFALPFDDDAVATYARQVPAVDLEAAAAEDLTPSLPRWRRVTGYTALAVAGASTLVGVGLAEWARRLSQEAESNPIQTDAAALNQRRQDRRRWAAISFGVAGGAAIAGGFALLWPQSPVQPVWTAGGSAAGPLSTFGLAGGF
jgi:Caspase domain